MQSVNYLDRSKTDVNTSCYMHMSRDIETLTSPEQAQQARRRLETIQKYLSPENSLLFQQKQQLEVLKTVFEETVFNVPDKSDQMTLRKMIEYLSGMVSFTKNDQSRLINQMRQEVEELQRKVKQGQLFYDDFKRQRETIASQEKLIASLRSQLNT